jgi:hypothetical protein
VALRLVESSTPSVAGNLGFCITPELPPRRT